MNQEITKERFWYALYFGILLLAASSDLALWNDGSQYLFRIINNGLFIDSLWQRYSDIIYQLPVLLSLKVLGPSILTSYVFKATLLLTPALTLFIGIRFFQSKGRNQAATFLFLVMAALLPSSLMFPVSTVNISLFAAALLLALFFGGELRLAGVLIFVISHLVLFFGHEYGYSVYGGLALFGLLKFNRPALGPLKGKYLALIEFLILLSVVYARWEVWGNKGSYLDFLITVQHSFHPLLFPVAFGGLLLTVMFGVNRFTRPLSWIIWFFVLSCFYSYWGNSLYFSVFMIRHFLFPILILLFFYFQFVKKDFEVNGDFLLQSVLLMLALFTKGAFLWRQVEFPTPKEPGCYVLSADQFGNWSPPGWSLPFLSIINQHSYAPSYVFVSPEAGRDGRCLRVGNYLVIGKSAEWNLVAFNERVRPTFDLAAKLPLLSLELPFEESGVALNLPKDASVNFKNFTPWKKGQCLFVKATSLTKPVLELFLDSTLVEKHVIEGPRDIVIPLKSPFRELSLQVGGRTWTNAYIKKVELITCP